MITPNKIWKYFLTDANNNSYVWQDGVVSSTAAPTELKRAPVGWDKIEIDFSTNSKYWNLARSFTLKLTFVDDGAEILRYLMNTGKGYEEDVYISILRWDRETGNYTLEYRGKVDMSQYSDDVVTGVSVNAIEGGILSFINANDGTDYDVLCDETNPDAVRILLTGMNLWCTNNFLFVKGGSLPGGVIEVIGNSNPESTNHTFPFVLGTQDGDSVGLIMGQPEYQVFHDTSNLVGNENYIVQSTNAEALISISANCAILIDPDIYPTTPFDYTIWYAIVDINSNTVSSKQQIYQAPPFGGTDLQNIKKLVIPKTDITLPPDSKLFIYGQLQNASDSRAIFIYPDDTQAIQIQTVSKAPDSLSYALKPLDLFKQLVVQISNGTCQANSNFFSLNNFLVAAAGDSIRNTAKGAGYAIQNYYFTTSFEDFFTSYNAVYNLGLKVDENGVLWIEPKADLYGDDGVIFDLGEVNDLTISVPVSYLANVLKCGYPNQDYDQSSGKFEFNTQTSFGLPVTSVKNDYDITSKYRGDAYGMEFIRANLSGKDTTDNDGDKSVFMIDCNVLSINKTFTSTISFTSTNIQFDNIDDISNFLIGDSVTFSGTAHNNLTGIVSAVVLAGTDDNFAFYITVSGATLTAENDVDVSINVVGTRVTQKRPDWTDIEGLPDNDPATTAYNITISPKRQLIAHGNYLRSLLYQQPEGLISFQSNSKNSQLSTTDQDGNVVNEDADVTINTLADPLFLPYQVEFTSKVPYRFSQILSQLGKGYIKMTYNGSTIYCLPIGTLKATPATNDAQKWSLLISPKTDLNTLFRLSGNGQFFFNMDNSVFISDLNPLHFVKYDYQLNKKYHETGMRNQWASERITNWLSPADYLQKWQTGDTIALQFITNGTADVEVKIFGCNSEYSQTMVDAVNIAVQAPNRLLQTSFDTSEWDEGNYLAVVYSDGIPVAISEPFSVESDCIETLLFEYANTYNLLDGYFGGWNPSIRIEAAWDTMVPDSDFTDYSDEKGNVELLSGIASYTKKLWLGSVYGIPDWMAMKMNRILLLNKILIDGESWARGSDSKITAHTTDGNPLAYYDVDMSPSNNDTGLESLLTNQSTMIYYGTLPDNADPTIANQFFLGNPNGDVICDFGILNTPCFPWIFIPKEYGLKNRWQDVNNTLMTGTIDNPGDLFQTKEFTINGIDGYLYKAQWITQFNNAPTTKLKFS